MVTWYAVPGYEQYEVSDDGRVRRGGVELRADAVGGYQRFRLYRNGKPKMVLLHRLMGQVFLPNPENLPVVRHLDDDRTNNVLPNLAWGTHADNTADAIRNGRWLNRGEGRRTCKAGLHDWTVGNIRSTWSSARGGRLVETCIPCERARRRARTERLAEARGPRRKPGPKTTRTPEEQLEARRAASRRYADAHAKEKAEQHRKWADEHREHLAEYARERRRRSGDRPHPPVS